MPRRLLASALLALALALTGLLAVGHGQSLTGEYKIGVLEPLTGPLAFEGKRHLEGYEIMRDMINERGGVMGRKLVFAVGDATDPTAAASEANRLITREGVKILTGTYSSTLCGAASEAAARHNVIYWESSCVDPRFTRRGLKTVFRTEIDGTGFGWYNIEFVAKHLAPRFGLKPNQLKIAFLSEDSSYGQGVTEAARQRAKGEFGLQALRPEGQRLEREFRETVQKKTGSYPLGGHQLAAGGLWVLKVVLDQARSDELDKFRATVMAMDLPVGSLINGWGVKFAENGQNANERVQHYMLQWQGGQLVTVWPEEFSTLRAKWIPLGSWDQRK